MSARELAEVFFACTSADNAKRKAGEEALRQLSRTPIYLSDLLQCAQASTELQVLSQYVVCKGSWNSPLGSMLNSLALEM